MMLKTNQLSTMLVIAPMMALHVAVALLAVAKQGQIRSIGQASATSPIVSRPWRPIGPRSLRYGAAATSSCCRASLSSCPTSWWRVCALAWLVAAYQAMLRAYWVGAQVILRACGQRPGRDRDGTGRNGAGRSLTPPPPRR